MVINLKAERARKVYLALLHYPVLDKHGDIVVSSVFSPDVHDLGRLAVSYNLGGCFIVNPVEAQKEFVKRITGHWLEGFGAVYNKKRSRALNTIRIMSDYSEVVETIEMETGETVRSVGTTAMNHTGAIGFSDLREQIMIGDKATLIIFGTGWGMHISFLENLEEILQPVLGVAGYNHLSVRSAASIIIDRLLGD